MRARRADNQARRRTDGETAGHLWRTNQGDGATKVFLYDTQGRATAQIDSQTLDLRSYASASTVNNLSSGVERTEVEYDKLGRPLQR